MKEFKKLNPSKINIIRSQPAILINHSEPIVAPVSDDNGENRIGKSTKIVKKSKLRK